MVAFTVSGASLLLGLLVQSRSKSKIPAHSFQAFSRCTGESTESPRTLLVSCASVSRTNCHHRLSHRAVSIATIKLPSSAYAPCTEGHRQVKLMRQVSRLLPTVGPHQARIINSGPSLHHSYSSTDLNCQANSQFASLKGLEPNLMLMTSRLQLSPKPFTLNPLHIQTAAGLQPSTESASSANTADAYS